MLRTHLNRMRDRLLRAGILLAIVVAGAAGQTLPLRLRRVLTGLDMPTDIASPRDGSGRLFVLEQRGRIRIVRNGALLPTPFLDIRSKVSCCGERGLLGLAFPPEFAAKGHLYINYTDLQGTTTVSRIRVSANPDTADPASEQVLLTIAQPFANHNGGGLAFSPRDGFLYIGMGDGGSANDPQNNGQRTDTLLGKMLRIDVESAVSPYSVPPTNPFVNNSGYRPEIWATGLRNPWRFSFDRETGDLWIGDVGQNRAEEVNFQPASSTGGENYGWRIAEGLRCNIPSACSLTGFTPPALEYLQSQGGCSVTGGYVYRGKRWQSLAGRFIYGDYCSGAIWGVRRTASGFDNAVLSSNSGLSITTFGEDENGEIFVAGQGGEIHLLIGGTPSTTSEGVVNAASFGAGLVPGSLATVFGNGITSFSGIIGAAQLPLPTEIAGTSVLINGSPVPLIGTASVSGQEQINFQVPFELASSSRATLTIRANGQSSDEVTVPIVTAQPEVFIGASGIPAVTAAAGGLVRQAEPVAKGSVITIWATGLGAVSNPPQSGGAASANNLSRVNASVDVRIGGVPAAVNFAGLAPNYAGLFQVNTIVPENAPSGEVELTLSTGGATSRPVKIWVR